MIKTTNLTKIFIHNKEKIKVFSGLNFSVQEGKSIAIVGESGRGKTTLLYVLSGLDKATDGEVLVNGYNIQDLSEKKSSYFRAENFGFVFQHHFLLSDLNAWDNCLLPLRILNKNLTEYEKKLENLFKKLNISERKTHFPDELSGGEKQRVAIIRALIHEPKIIFADEPTGSLDVENSKILENLFLGLCREQNITLILSTHNMNFAQLCDEIYDLNKEI